MQYGHYRVSRLNSPPLVIINARETHRSLQCDQLQLGNMYAVLSKRRGRVVDEDLVDGTQVSRRGRPYSS